MKENVENIVYADPARFKSSSWDADKGRSIPGGDIAESYSADMIGQKSTFRKPFKWKDGLRISTGMKFTGSYGGVRTNVTTYRLVPIEYYKGKSHTHQEASKLNYLKDDGEYHHGFTYNGMRVKKGKQEYVMCDELIFMPREEKQQEQLTLF